MSDARAMLPGLPIAWSALRHCLPATDLRTDDARSTHRDIHREHICDDPNASSSGRFRIGGEAEIKRLNYSSMRLTEGIWGARRYQAGATRAAARGWCSAVRRRKLIPERDRGPRVEDVVTGVTTCMTLIGADQNALACETGGPSNGPTAILLHGGGQSRSSWRIATRRLGDAQFKACALDLRGHGDSDWSPDGIYRIERFVADLVRAIETLGSPAILIGASFGGHVALVTAARHPSLVRALVLCDVTPWIEGEATKAMRGALSTAAAGFASVQDAADHIDEMRGAPSHLDPSRLRRHMRQGTDGRLYWRWDPQFFRSQDMQDENLTELLTTATGDLKAPTLLIRAELSEIVTAQQVSKFTEMVPHARTAEVAGARHNVSADDNDQYASLILGFLDDIGTHSSQAKPR